MPECAKCQKEFQLTRQQRLRPGIRSNFCGSNCYRSFMDSRIVTFTCTHCGKDYSMSIGSKRCRKRKGIPENLCSPCARGLANKADGAKNGQWRGGHRHWSPGRFGRDKDGLSWKAQRRLAWERDNYTCQGCGVRPKRNPDVHHVIPFRISQSHALENLKCLCQGCHLKLEATVQEQWGGQLHVALKRPEPRVDPTPKTKLAPKPPKVKPVPKPMATRPVAAKPTPKPRTYWLSTHKTPKNTARWSDDDLVQLAPQASNLSDLMRSLGFKTTKGYSRSLLLGAMDRLGLHFSTIKAPVG